MKFPTGHEANLFTGRGKNYITLVNYFSDFVEVDELEDTTSHAVLKLLYSNSVDKGFRTLLFQTKVYSLAVRSFTSFQSAGNSTM